jgi:hypothetical protein
MTDTASKVNAAEAAAPPRVAAKPTVQRAGFRFAVFSLLGAPVKSRTALLRLNVHMHALVLDGLDPELCGDAAPELCHDEPGLAAGYAAAAQGVSVSGDRAGKPPLSLVLSPRCPARPRASDVTDQPIAEVRGPRAPPLTRSSSIPVLDQLELARPSRPCELRRARQPP